MRWVKELHAMSTDQRNPYWSENWFTFASLLLAGVALGKDNNGKNDERNNAKTDNNNVYLHFVS
jgi:hypothetical protein